MEEEKTKATEGLPKPPKQPTRKRDKRDLPWTI